MKRNLRILLDIDGILANFVAGASQLFNRDPASVKSWNFMEEWGIVAEDFWAPMGRQFWRELPLTSEAHDIIRACEGAVGAENICFLTSPCLTNGCIDGKLDWVKQHFPDYSRRVLVGAAKQFCASPTSLLIDDHQPNCHAFRKAGGYAILFPRPWNVHAEHEVHAMMFLKDRLGAFIDV